MIKTNVYSIKGTRLTQITLPKIFDEPVNKTLLSQAIHVYRDRAHPGLSKVKTRGEVNRTKAKWYRQKGTGRARHGAKSAPIFVGGGVAHGPKGLKRKLSLPKNMAKKALNSALSYKAKKGEIIVVDGFEKIKKTKEAKKFLEKLFPQKQPKTTFCLSEENKKVFTFLRNLANTKVKEFKDMNAFDVFFGGILILDKKIFASKK